MSKIINICGKKFNRLTVIKRVSNSKNHHSRWLCECDCGNKKIVIGTNLTRGITKSCGCLAIENGKQSNLKHGKSKTRLYHIFNNIKQRCYNMNNQAYYRYGSRGITMCQEWLNDFGSFYDWAMTNGYKDNLTIDRIDNNGNYEPSNCRWVDYKTQSNNVRNNIIYELDGVYHTLSEWCDIFNMPYKTVYRRLKIANETFKNAITKPINTNKRNKLYKGGIKK